MKIRFILFNLMLFSFASVCLSGQMQDWTWLYKKYFSKFERTKYQKEVVFSKSKVPKFTQLILSWNAHRPKKGFYSFWVQARNSKTKKWFPWHRMIEWGNAVQESHYSNFEGATEGCYVRLEVPNKILADGFKIKIKTHKGADFSGLAMLTANLSNFKKFKLEPKNDVVQLPSLKINGIPKFSQMILDHDRAKHLCSPTSTSMLVSYLKGERVDPVDFAGKVYDKGLDVFGSWPFNTAAAFEECNGKSLFYVKRLSSFLHLYDYLRHDTPVVVSVRGSINGAPKDYNNGHLLLVVGWNQADKKVICHDPALASDEKTLKEYDVASFLRAWESSRRLAYISQA